MRTLQGLAADLLEGLADAERQASADQTTYGREGAICALNAVCQFVLESAKRLPDPQMQANMLGRKTILDRLALALIDLQHGTVSPVLKPNKSFNRPPLPLHVQIARGYAAAAVEILHLAGISIELAAKKVAKHIEGREELSGIDRASWKAVQRWRADIVSAEHRPTWASASKPLTAMDVVTFDELMRSHALLLADGKTAPEQRRDFAMRMLDAGRKGVSPK